MSESQKARGNTECKEFPLGEILTVTTQRFVARERDDGTHGMDGVWEIVEFMTGQHFLNIHLPAAVARCSPYLLKEHPSLERVQIPDSGLDTIADVQAWLSTQEAEFGKSLSVSRIDDEYRASDLATPMEFAEMAIAAGVPTTVVIQPHDGA